MAQAHSRTCRLPYQLRSPHKARSTARRNISARIGALYHATQQNNGCIMVFTRAHNLKQ